MQSDLDRLYKESLENETKELKSRFELIIGKARDKRFALEYVGAIYLIQYGFNNGNLLSKRILTFHESAHKLGASISEIVIGIVDVIKEYKTESENHWKNNKKKIRHVSLKWKKGWLGLPIIFDGFQIEFNSSENPYLVAGPFMGLSSTDEIASELGEMMALEQFIKYIKSEYIKYGGILDNFSNRIDNLHEKLQDLQFSLCNENLDTFFLNLKSIFASLPYQLSKAESDYHNIIHTILYILGFKIVSEYSTNLGRIDAVIETDNLVYIMEFKVDSDLAINQIIEKKYHERFLGIGKKIILIGVNISSKEKNVNQWERRIVSPEQELL